MIAGIIGIVAVSTASAQSAPSFAPAGWDADLRLREAADRSPDPKILEIDLTARVAEVEIAPARASRPGPTMAACRVRWSAPRSATA